MDRPAGPRQPDKRNEAYESIFGRPSASHHQVGQQYPGQAPHYAQSLQHGISVHGVQYHNPQHHNQPYPSQSQHDRRTSNSFTQPQNYYPNHLPHNSQQPPFRQSYPHTAASQSQLPPHHYGLHAQHTRPHTLAPPIIHGRTRSVVSSPHTAGIISPLPDDPPDESLEDLTRAGLTPAQAYQAQVYRNNPANQQQFIQQANSTREPSLNGSYHRVSNDVPRLGINLDLEDSGLNIDFGSDQGPEESTSELPWATSSINTGANARGHTRGLHSHISGPVACVS